MAQSFTIGLLITGADVAELHDVAPDGHAGLYHRWLGQGELSFRAWDVFDGVLPQDAAAADAYIVTGSPAGVYENWGWIPRLETFVRAAAETRPVLGVCFGHQLLAQAFGGKVAKSDRGWGLGLQRYQIAPPQDWLSAEDELRLIAMHQDQVLAPPPGAQVFARNAFCPVAGFRLGARVMGLQGHPEFTPAFARRLYEERAHRLTPDGLAQAQASLQEEPGAHAIAADVVGWMRSVRKSIAR